MAITDWLLVAAGLAALVGGFVVLRLARRDLRNDGAHDNSAPTRLTVGLVLLVAGYHLAVWGLPLGIRPIAVPPDRWWLVAAVGGLAVAGALVADALDARH